MKEFTIHVYNLPKVYHLSRETLKDYFTYEAVPNTKINV